MTRATREDWLSLEIRRIKQDEMQAFFRTIAFAFGGEPRETEEFVRHREFFWEHGYYLAGFDGSDIVATSGAFDLTLTIPGGELPTAGVTVIGVLPTHRRKGLLSRMMRMLIDDAREQGRPLAALWASEEAIYQRFGFGMATLGTWMSIEPHRAHLRGRPEPVGQTRLLDVEEAAKTLPSLFERVRVMVPGTFVRDESWYRGHTLFDPPIDREGATPYFIAVWEDDDGPGAYAIYRTKEDWSKGFGAGKVTVNELVAVSPLAAREIFRFVLGIDLMDRVTGALPEGGLPYALMLEEPRRLRLKTSDSLWLRIVDVAESLSARSYAAEGSVVIGVVDPYCTWNDGRWRLETGPEGATCEATDDEPELTVEVIDLASIYLGAFTFHQLAHAGRVVENVAGALDRADALFRTDIAPWCPETF